MVALLTILPAATSAAAEPPAAHQYIESVPPTSGDSGSGDEPRERLPDDVERKVQAQGGEDTEALKTVATSPDLGAPQAKTDGRVNTDANRGGQQPASDDDPSSLDAATSAPLESGSDSPWILLAGLVAVSAAVGAAVITRRRRSHR